MAKKFDLPHSIPKKYYAAIGEVAARSALLEHQIGELIWTILGLGPKEGRVLTHGMAMKPKANMLHAMSLKWIENEKLRREARAVSKEARTIKDYRDKFVHGLWGRKHGDETDLMCLMKMGSGEERILPRAEQIHPDDIRAVADKYIVLQERVQRLIEGVLADRK